MINIPRPLPFWREFFNGENTTYKCTAKDLHNLKFLYQKIASLPFRWKVVHQKIAFLLLQFTLLFPKSQYTYCECRSLSSIIIRTLKDNQINNEITIFCDRLLHFLSRVCHDINNRCTGSGWSRFVSWLWSTTDKTLQWILCEHHHLYLLGSLSRH